MKHIKYIVSFLLVISVIFLNACSTVVTGSKELKIGVSGAEGKYSPFYAVTEADKQISAQVYPTVQIREPNNRLKNYCGGITYKVDGEKVKYTVSIRDDLYFSNGKNVTIDDIIFFYHFIADASYDGVYRDWYLNDIEGLKEYYYDDKNYEASILNIEGKVAASYSPSVISPENLSQYLIATGLDGKFNEKKAPDGTEWKAYFEKHGLSADYTALGKKPGKDKLLGLAAKAEAAANKDAYNAEKWFYDKLVSEYIKRNYDNGISVPEISGIRKINDYTCTIQFNSRNINAVSAINAAIISKEFYSVDYVKGLADKVKNAENYAPGCGAYVIGDVDEDRTVLTVNEYYPEKPDFEKLEFINYKKSEDEIFEDVRKGGIDVASVYATSDRISKLSDSECKYFVTNDDGYYTVLMNPKKLDILQRKALSGLCDLNTAVESRFGKSYTVPLAPMSVRFPEYPAHITEKKFGIMDYTSYMLNGINKMTTLNGYYTGDESGIEYLILSSFKDILAEKKITLNIHNASASGIEEAAASGKADIWVSRIPDGASCDEYSRYNSLGSDNPTGYSTAEIDDITERIHTSVGILNRTAMAEKSLETIMSEALECPVCQLQKITVYNTSNISSESFGEDFIFDGFAYALSELKASGGK